MDNRRRVLAEVLAIDSWHSPVSDNGASSSVHVELSFRNGRLGGDDEVFPFTFNISLKRALLTISVEEPLKIDRNSVARQIPANQGEFERIMAARDEARTKIELGGKLSPNSLSAALNGSFSNENANSNESKMRIVQTVPRIIAKPSPGGSREYFWELTPGYEDTLDGQPWNPSTEPRFVFKRPDMIGKRDPVVKVTLSCGLADIEITDVQLKDKGVASIFKEMIINKANRATAIQHLKLVLRDMQLEFGRFDDRFSNLVIADMLCVEQ